MKTESISPIRALADAIEVYDMSCVKWRRTLKKFMVNAAKGRNQIMLFRKDAFSQERMRLVDMFNKIISNRNFDAEVNRRLHIESFVQTSIDTGNKGSYVLTTCYLFDLHGGRGYSDYTIYDIDVESINFNLLTGNLVLRAWRQAQEDAIMRRKSARLSG